SGPVSLQPPEQARLIKVESACEMLARCQLETPDVFIGVAAVADFRPEAAMDRKLKKPDSVMTLSLIPNPDILATMATRNPRPFCAGFAAETENLEGYAREKLRAKKIDLIFANLATRTFGSEDNTVTAYWQDGWQDLGTASKHQLARTMISLIAQRRDRS
ncbi:MAG: phosphopantothenoylcysteine decarboxylase, partial [Pseudohongiellaceae bacterium]